MTASSNWRTEVDAATFFGNQKKRNEIEQRRPPTRKASDLRDLGPGLRVENVRISDWNDILALSNGYYTCLAAGGHNPTDAEDWTGHVVNDGKVGGTQTATGMVSGNTYRRVFTRGALDERFVEFSLWNIVTGVLLLNNGQTMAQWFTAHPNLGVPVGTVVFEKQA